MTFKVEAVLTDDNWLQLSDPFHNNSWNNTFSLVIGQNATGKSRLLRKIVSNYIFENKGPTRNQYSHYNPSTPWSQSDYYSSNREVTETYFSNPLPENVIAVSTGRHDRFPSPLHLKGKPTQVEYHYIGPAADRGNSISSITRSVTAILQGLLNYNEKFSSLSHIFDYLGFIPYLNLKFSADPRVNGLKRRNGDDWQYLIPELINAENRQDYNYELIEKFNRFSDPLNNKHGGRLEINLNDYAWRHKNYDLHDAIDLLNAGLIKISDITLISQKNKDRLRFSQASSGQQCMLTMILGIAGAIKDDSLICIDEPEISLHPRWQADIVRQLQTVFEEYQGCHFIIATHSPQIVSGLTTENGYVLSLEDRKFYRSDEYARRSADFQLAEIFNTPGHNNEYLIRIALTLLTKLSNEQPLTNVDRQKIEWLSIIGKDLSDKDPVFHLINQVRMLGLGI
ncbi:restriction system-associated AAA family ATPase [compost metagenome]